MSISHTRTLHQQAKHRLALTSLFVVLAFAVGLQAVELTNNSHKTGTDRIAVNTDATNILSTNTVSDTKANTGKMAFTPVVAPTDRALPNGPAPMYWTDGDNAYRAVHFISRWNPAIKQWEQISPDLTLAAISDSEGYSVDGITAVAHTDGSTPSSSTPSSSTPSSSTPSDSTPSDSTPTGASTPTGTSTPTGAPASNDPWYVGTLCGNVWVNLDGTWVNHSDGLPDRTVSSVAMSPGSKDGRVAVVGMDGYGAATPDRPGHVYLTLDGGNHWRDITGNLPDAPVTSIHFVSANGHMNVVAEVQGTHFTTTLGSVGMWVAWNLS